MIGTKIEEMQKLPKYLVYEDGAGQMVRQAIRFRPCDCVCHTADWHAGDRDCLHCSKERSDS